MISTATSQPWGTPERASSPADSGFCLSCCPFTFNRLAACPGQVQSFKCLASALAALWATSAACVCSCILLGVTSRDGKPWLVLRVPTGLPTCRHHIGLHSKLYCKNCQQSEMTETKLPCQPVENSNDDLRFHEKGHQSLSRVI